MSNLCSSRDLQYMCDRFEYRVYPSAVIDHLILESGLSKGAQILWILLWRGSALNEGIKCEASVSFLEKMTTWSASTLWRAVKELRAKDYLLVVTREGADGKNLPNIYGPRLPKKVAKEINHTATPREVVSTQLTIDHINAVGRDYHNEPTVPDEAVNDVECDVKIGQEVCAGLSESLSDSVSDDYSHNRKAVTDQLKDKPLLINKGVKSEVGESVRSETQYTNYPLTEDYTKTSVHSRDQWKMYPHIRSQVLNRLRDFGLDINRSKVLVKEIDYTLNFGSMKDWTV